MITTYELIGGRHITGDTDDVDLMHFGRELTEEDWAYIQKAIKAGRTVISLAHVVSIHKPSDTDMDRYRAVGY